ncbi:hypothetical protein GCM10022233_29290 [Streptomyces shaanxiensis]|uniref:Uncharacterized protein n=1 Tax=Streptomyces shaanxiensis TaxID=653357 RepID=A0ABP7UYG4_9ACTN
MTRRSRIRRTASACSGVRACVEVFRGSGEPQLLTAAGSVAPLSATADLAEAGGGNLDSLGAVGLDTEVVEGRDGSVEIWGREGELYAGHRVGRWNLVCAAIRIQIQRSPASGCAVGMVQGAQPVRADF